jgi:hypothetical protein
MTYPASSPMGHSHQCEESNAENEVGAPPPLHQYNYDNGSWTPMINQEDARPKYTYPRPREDETSTII